MRRTALCLMIAGATSCAPDDQDVPFPSSPVRAELRAEIGELAGPPEYLLGQVVGVAVGGDGVVYVADAIGSSVRAYDRDGRYLTTIGSEGDGPGEFRYLLGLDMNTQGELTVRGAFRLSVFRQAAGGGVADSLIRTVPLEAPTPDRDKRGRGAGPHYYGPGYLWEGFQRRGYFYLAFDSLGAITDTIFVPPFADPETTGLANYMVSAEGGRNLQGVSRAPFEPKPSWDITPAGHVIFTPGDRYEIVEVGVEGDTVRVIEQAVSPTAVPDDEWSDSARAFNARVDSIPVPLSQVRGMSVRARERSLPEVLPSILSVHTGEGGGIWVRRWPRAGVEETVFDVFDAEGEPLRRVQIPVRLKSTPAIWLSGDMVAGVVVDAMTGVERVVVYGLTGTRATTTQ